MQWNRDQPSRKPKDEPNKNKLKNFVQHTADVMGSKDNPDLLVLYHTTPNGIKDRVLEGKYSGVKGLPKAKMDTIMNRLLHHSSPESKQMNSCFKISRRNVNVMLRPRAKRILAPARTQSYACG